jgi:hypothetical protein
MYLDANLIEGAALNYVIVSDYDDEVQQRWGNTEQFRESTDRTSKYTHADFAAAKIDQEAVTEKFATAFGNGVDYKSVEVQSIVTAHRVAISKWFYECSVEMQRNLALMYINDERFKKYYDGRVRGLAQYVHDAIMAQ